MEILVEHAHLDKNAAEEHVSAHLTVLEDNAEMMDVEESLVDLVLLLKPAKTDSVQELLWLTVREDNAEIIEPVETVETVPLVNDVDLVSVSAIMTVTKEIVEMQAKPTEPTLVSAHKDHVEPVPQVLLVEPMDVVLLKHLVMF